ncbi:16S rRNA (cytosine(1402)-N(4))-methyltransferase RsmH [Candidatus Microgenomates bacterium]|nr:16S rRNA (cytosine(1402)-N(4))-methyltransferase RsmH [Candidatus Microgenomates bacterium]
MEEVFHTPVLLPEVIEGLKVRRGKKYIDATLGGGGHGIEIIKMGGRVLGIDVDEEAIGYVKEKIKSQPFDFAQGRKSKVKTGQDLILVKGNFRDIGEIARTNGFERVAGIIFDLGVSSHQLNRAERGFSFQKEGPLDMRMDKALSVTAADLINGLYKNELIYIFEKFGEERLARRIADAIISARAIKRIETTGELAAIIEKVSPKRGKIHPATRVFQALRIAVNDELESLERGLLQAKELLEKGGRIVAISFHSLEDRIVKRSFAGGELLKKPITASVQEIALNPKARSAKLRIYAKN